MKKRLLSFIKQGLSPEKLALCVALGIVIGIFPALGTTTLLCTLAALMLRLNLAAIQSVNYLVYPLQFLALIPFYRLGERLFHAPRLEMTAQGVKSLIQSGVPNAVHILWDTTMHAVAAWCLMAPLATGALYLLFTPLFRRLASQNKPA